MNSGSKIGKRYGGRQKGTPNKSKTLKEQQIIELLDSIVDWTKFYQTVYTRILKGDMKAAKLLDERRWGKPAQSINNVGNVPFKILVEYITRKNGDSSTS